MASVEAADDVKPTDFPSLMEPLATTGERSVGCGGFGEAWWGGSGWFG